jgi:CDP-diacylglycerol--glycerol-3-phosphate 3-phosphatidyltransferase
MSAADSSVPRGAVPAAERREERRRRLRREALNIPNLLTYGRILAIPAVMFFMAFDSVRNAFVASMIFALASVTDAIDGWVARRFDQSSALGKLLDPLADKLLVLGALLMLLDLGRVEVWVVLVLLAREMMITGLRSVAAAEGFVIAARELGKTKTAFQMVGLWALIIHHPYPLEGMAEPLHFDRLGRVFLYISVVFSIVSAVDYFVGFARALAARGDDEGPDDRKSA